MDGDNMTTLKLSGTKDEFLSRYVNAIYTKKNRYFNRFVKEADESVYQCLLKDAEPLVSIVAGVDLHEHVPTEAPAVIRNNVDEVSVTHTAEEVVKNENRQKVEIGVSNNDSVNTEEVTDTNESAELSAEELEAVTNVVIASLGGKVSSAQVLAFIKGQTGVVNQAVVMKQAQDEEKGEQGYTVPAKAVTQVIPQVSERAKVSAVEQNQSITESADSSSVQKGVDNDSAVTVKVTSLPADEVKGNMQKQGSLNTRGTCTVNSRPAVETKHTTDYVRTPEDYSNTPEDEYVDGTYDDEGDINLLDSLDEDNGSSATVAHENKGSSDNTKKLGTISKVSETKSEKSVSKSILNSSNVVYEQNMSVVEFLRVNKRHNTVEEILQFFSQRDIDAAVKSGKVFKKRNKLII